MMTVWQQQFPTKRDTFLKDKIVEIEYFTLKMSELFLSYFKSNETGCSFFLIVQMTRKNAK